MKIEIVKFNDNWKQKYKNISSDLSKILKKYEIQIDHIGSTSIENLSAKPIIDILIGLKNENDLNEIAALLANNNYVYYEVYNSVMPYRRFFLLLIQKVDGKLIISDENDLNIKALAHSNRIAHIHIIPKNSIHWMRHIAFKEYLNFHKDVRNEYQNLKNNLSTLEWKDGNDYNSAKNDFIKHYENLAISWYKNNFF